MPTYEYECKSCRGVMEIFQSITAKPLRKAACEACGGQRPVRRLISTGGAVLFKGSGFYQTDYRSEGYKKAAESDKPKAESSDAKTKDAKPEAAAPKPDSPKPESTKGPSTKPPKRKR